MRALAVVLCLLLPAAAWAQDEFWCWNADEILSEVEGDQVHLFHLGALLNCCPEPITYDIEVGDATILVEERSLYVCDCDCCYSLEVTIEDVPPGPWNVLYRWFDVEVWEWAERVLEIVVDDVGQGLDPFVAEQAIDGCLDSASAPEEQIEPRSWGAIKALYGSGGR